MPTIKRQMRVMGHILEHASDHVVTPVDSDFTTQRVLVTEHLSIQGFGDDNGRRVPPSGSRVSKDQGKCEYCQELVFSIRDVCAGKSFAVTLNGHPARRKKATHTLNFGYPTS